MKLKYTQSGYTLLFAVIISSLVLSVAMFILSVSKKQFQLATAARESMKASYNAKSARECTESVSWLNIASSTGKLEPGTDFGIGESHAWTYTDNPSSGYYTPNVPPDPAGFTAHPGILSSLHTPTCNGVPLVQSSFSYDSTTNVTTWSYYAIPFGQDPDIGCAIITYTTSPKAVGTGGITSIAARGYSVCKYDSSSGRYNYDTGNANTVERAQNVSYPRW